MNRTKDISEKLDRMNNRLYKVVEDSFGGARANEAAMNEPTPTIKGDKVEPEGIITDTAASVSKIWSSLERLERYVGVIEEM